jgi:hypothetical protein
VNTANVSTIRLKPIVKEQYCGDYCGICPACLQLDKWLIQTHRGKRKIYKSNIEVRSLCSSTHEAIREASKFYLI